MFHAIHISTTFLLTFSFETIWQQISSGSLDFLTPLQFASQLLVFINPCIWNHMTTNSFRKSWFPNGPCKSPRNYSCINLFIWNPMTTNSFRKSWFPNVPCKSHRNYSFVNMFIWKPYANQLFQEPCIPQYALQSTPQLLCINLFFWKPYANTFLQELLIPQSFLQSTPQLLFANLFFWKPYANKLVQESVDSPIFPSLHTATAVFTNISLKTICKQTSSGTLWFPNLSFNPHRNCFLLTLSFEKKPYGNAFFQEPFIPQSPLQSTSQLRVINRSFFWKHVKPNYSRNPWFQNLPFNPHRNYVVLTVPLLKATWNKFAQELVIPQSSLQSTSQIRFINRSFFENTWKQNSSRNHLFPKSFLQTTSQLRCLNLSFWNHMQTQSSRNPLFPNIPFTSHRNYAFNLFFWKPYANAFVQEVFMPQSSLQLASQLLFINLFIWKTHESKFAPELFISKSSLQPTSQTTSYQPFHLRAIWTHTRPGTLYFHNLPFNSHRNYLLLTSAFGNHMNTHSPRNSLLTHPSFNSHRSYFLLTFPFGNHMHTH